MDLIDREQALNVLDAEAWSFTEYLQKDIGNVFDVHLACFADDVRERLKDMPTVQAVPIEVLQEIRQEIESNMESIIGRYDASTPEHNRPSHKIERNNGRKECIDIIDKHIKQIEGSGTE